MAAKKSLDILIQEDIEAGLLPFLAIARKHGVSYSTVEDIWLEMVAKS